MKTVLMMTGLPGSGKTTWIRENGLDDYVISKTALRKLLCGITYDNYGRKSIEKSRDSYVHSEYLKLIEMRMIAGSFIVIDNTNLKLSNFKEVKLLADYYGYSVYVKEMKTPFEECLLRNSNRNYIDRVPESDLATYKKRQQILDIRSFNKIDSLDELSTKEKSMYHITSKSDIIYVVGDIHGCYTELDNFLTSEFNKNKDKSLLVFAGDYVDRGPNNLEVVKKLIEISESKDIKSIFLEGNHELHLRTYSHLREILSPQFKNYTMPQLDQDPDLKFYLRLFLMRLCPYVFINNKYIICHGGISSQDVVTKGLVYTHPSIVIKGSDYPNGQTYEIDSLFDKLSDSNIIQIHGHRESLNKGVRVGPRINDSVVNLEGSVEMGGDLLVAKIEHNNIKVLKF